MAPIPNNPACTFEPETYQAIVENLSEMICRFTRDGKVLFINQAYCDYFNVQREGMIGTTYMPVVYEADREMVDAKVATISEENPVVVIENRVLCGNGTCRWTQWINRGFFDEAGQLVELQSVGRDIQDLKDIEERLRDEIQRREELEAVERERQKQLMQADRLISLGILVSGVAHEVSNPNHRIATHAAALKKFCADIIPILEKYYRENGDFRAGGRDFSSAREVIPEMLENIMEGSRRITSIVNQLRDYAQEKKIEHKTEVDLNAVCESAVGFLGKMLRQSSDRFSTEYASDLPLVRGSFQQLEQVVVNLLQNACQALENREQAIVVRTLYDKSRHVLLLEVLNEGEGIPEANLQRLTHPFFTTRDSTGNMGLGLSIVDRIAQEHGGDIFFESPPDAMTRVTLTLPLDQAAVL